MSTGKNELPQNSHKEEVSVDIWKITVEELEGKEKPEGQAKKD